MWTQTHTHTGTHTWADVWRRRSVPVSLCLFACCCSGGVLTLQSLPLPSLGSITVATGPHTPASSRAVGSQSEASGIKFPTKSQFPEEVFKVVLSQQTAPICMPESRKELLLWKSAADSFLHKSPPSAPPFPADLKCISKKQSSSTNQEAAEGWPRRRRAKSFASFKPPPPACCSASESPPAGCRSSSGLPQCLLRSGTKTSPLGSWTSSFRGSSPCCRRLEATWGWSAPSAGRPHRIAETRTPVDPQHRLTALLAAAWHTYHSVFSVGGGERRRRQLQQETRHWSCELDYTTWFWSDLTLAWLWNVLQTGSLKPVWYQCELRLLQWDIQWPGRLYQTFFKRVQLWSSDVGARHQYHSEDTLGNSELQKSSELIFSSCQKVYDW